MEWIIRVNTRNGNIVKEEASPEEMRWGGRLLVSKFLLREIPPTCDPLGRFNRFIIAPGPILTEQTKQYSAEVFASWNVGRAVEKDGLPEDVADAALFLASDRSDWVTGATLDVNGGILIR